MNTIDRLAPGIRTLRSYRAKWLRLRRRRRRGAHRDPRPAGHGVRRAGRAPRRHRALHDHRLPGRLRVARPVTGPRARTRLLGVTADPGDDHAADRRRRRPGERARPGGHVGDPRRRHRDRPRTRPVGVHRRPAVERGPRRLPQRPRRHHHRRSAPEVVRLLDRRRVLRPRGGRVRRGLDETNAATLVTGLAVLVVLLVLPRLTRKVPPCWSPSSAPRSRPPRSTWPPTGWPRWARSPGDPASRRSRGRRGPTSGRCSWARSASPWCRSPTRSRPPSSFAAAARRRGRPEPGDDRCRRRQRRCRVPPGLRHLGERFADRGGRPGRRPDASSPASSAPGSWCCCSSRSTTSSPISPRPRSPPSSSPPPCRSPISRAAPLCRGAAVVAHAALVATCAGVIFWGVLQGIVLAIVLAVVLFFRRSWSPNGVVLGEVPTCPVGTAPATSRRRGAARRRGVPVGGAAVLRELRAVPRRVRRLARTRQPQWIVLQCEAITDIDVTAGEMLERSRRGAQRGRRAPGVRGDAQRLQELALRYGLLETLDRDHFYPTMRVALEVIDESEPTEP